VRLSRFDVRDHINCRKNDRWPSHRFYRALQRLKSSIRYIFEIFGVSRFSSFSTQSSEKQTSLLFDWRRPLWRKAASLNIGGVRRGACHEIEMISKSFPDAPTSCPTALSIGSLATGYTKEREPALGAASSSPTIRYFCTRPIAAPEGHRAPKGNSVGRRRIGDDLAVRALAESSANRAKALLLAAAVHSRHRSSAPFDTPREPIG
jgi:hypothetical protein